MIKIIHLFSQIGFIPDKDGTYIGCAYKEEYGKTKFEFKDHVMTCTVKYDSKPEVLFSIIYGDAQLGTIIILLQEYGIINFEFVKNHILDTEVDWNEFIQVCSLGEVL